MEMNMTENNIEKRNFPVKKMSWSDYYLWRIPAPGIWAWTGTRISALFIIGLFVLHLFYTYNQMIQLMLLMMIIFHGSLGIRLIIIDFFELGGRMKKFVTIGLAAVGISLFLLIWNNLPRL